MYIPKHFDEPQIDILHALMRAHPLAVLVTLSSDGLIANHIPLLLSDQPAPLGTLRGHVARANSIWTDVVKDVEVLAVFQGPDAYISPSWYPTKREHGKAVPTWNYAVAHAYGSLRVVDDATWLRAHLEALTSHHEAALPEPWHISDAPGDYIDKMMAAVVGIEINITRLLGKCKVSQNQPAQNQVGVIAGLRARGDTQSLAMAELVGKSKIARC